MPPLTSSVANSGKMKTCSSMIAATARNRPMVVSTGTPMSPAAGRRGRMYMEITNTTGNMANREIGCDHRIEAGEEAR